ncbi:shikimate kinase [Paenibacillus polygoni]|uniref:Shikimate kinase n=1 Tax=Paenibacillus polygoni TaxID=3050112 RepID=A0ABY8X118_9BACL|nr:shikimate kinase [Paenibacillus polygoni]WIV18177.1 shikimate kinase [Paenibacillus polygoni]
MSSKADNIILIGMMGTGKTTVSSILAQELGYTLIDIDNEIEVLEGCPIPILFQEKGESYFRQVESDTLCRVLKGTSQIVSTGGGSVLQAKNRELMKEAGWVIALTASAESIISRVSSNGDRPLLAGNIEERVKNIMKERKDAYSFADVTVDTSELSPEEVVRHILTLYRV